MRKLLLVFILVGLGAYYGPEIGSWFHKPCAKPISYSLGTFDERFGISRTAFLSALSDAEALWEAVLPREGGSTGKELFTYAPDHGTLAVNLIYDHRQEVTQELNTIEKTVKTGEKSYDALEEKYQSLKADYASLKKTYDAAVSAFNAHSAAYERDVERWNSGRRNSREEFDNLESERVALEAELSSVKSLETNLNSLVKELNSTVERLNTLAKELNLNVEEYNTIGASRGETFAGGTYTLDQDGPRIDIFEFENHAKLVRVLAHELGHALGLEHVEGDPKAIMYYLNEGENEKLTKADISALKLLCGVN